MYLYVGGRRRNMRKSRKYVRTPHRRSGGPLGGGGGSRMIVLGEGWPRRTSLGIFLPSPPLRQVSTFTSVGRGGGAVAHSSPPWCSILLRTFGDCLFRQRGWTPVFGRLCPSPAPTAPRPRCRNILSTCHAAQIRSGRAVCASAVRQNVCCTHL